MVQCWFTNFDSRTHLYEIQVIDWKVVESGVKQQLTPLNTTPFRPSLKICSFPAPDPLYHQWVGRWGISPPPQKDIPILGHHIRQ